MALPRPDPSLAWRLVNEQDVPLRAAAERLGIGVPEIMVLLATYCPPPAPVKKPIVRPAPPPPRDSARPRTRRRVDLVEAWRAAESGATVEQIANEMGFSADGMRRALAREATRRGCPDPTQVVAGQGVVA